MFRALMNLMAIVTALSLFLSAHSLLPEVGQWTGVAMLFASVGLSWTPVLAALYIREEKVKSQEGGEVPSKT